MLISVIYLVASGTSLLDADPMLWFTMMLIPTGPTAMKLTALADVSGSNENEKMSIAKVLSVAYAVSPLICCDRNVLKVSSIIPHNVASR